MNNSNKRKPLLESHKSFFNYFKHITTLNTAAILLMVTFLEKAFKNPEGKILVALAFICFVLSLICSVLTMYRFAWLIWHEEEVTWPKKSKFKRFIERVSFFVSKYGFIIGMVLLALFGIINIGNSYSGYYER